MSEVPQLCSEFAVRGSGFEKVGCWGSGLMGYGSRVWCLSRPNRAKASRCRRREAATKWRAARAIVRPLCGAAAFADPRHPDADAIRVPPDARQRPSSLSLRRLVLRLLGQWSKNAAAAPANCHRVRGGSTHKAKGSSNDRLLGHSSCRREEGTPSTLNSNPQT